MSPNNYNKALDNTRHYCCYRCSAHTQFWKTVFSIYKKIIKYNINKYGNNSRHHRLHAIACFPQTAGVNLRNAKRHKRKKHNRHILFGITHRQSGINCCIFSMKIKSNQILSGKYKSCQSGKNTKHAYPYFHADTIPKSVHIALTIILGSINTRSGYSSKNSQTKNKN